MGNEKYGIHGLGTITNMTLWNRFKPALHGFRFRQGWKGYETAAGTFSLTYWKDQFDIAVADGKYISFISIVAPTSSNNTPAWIYNSPYSVPLRTSDRGTDAYFLNSNWITRFKNHWDQFPAIIAAYTSGEQLLFICWQSGEAWTGDEGSGKGTISQVSINGVVQPSVTPYIISDSDWSTHKRTNLWPYGSALAATTAAANFMVNVANDGHDYEWVKANMPGLWMKFGFPTHNYDIPGEAWQAEMGDGNRASSTLANRIQAEFESTLTQAWFTPAPKQNIKAIFASACHIGIDIINISLANLSALFGTDLSLITWINQFLGYRQASETDRGFCVFRKMIDFTDDWSAITSEPLIDPAQLATYNSRVAAINANSFYGTIQKKYKTSKERCTYLNPALVTALRAAFPLAAYHAPSQTEDQDAYNQDFGIDMIAGNYYRFIQQINPETTTTGVYRIGSTADYHGRTGRKGAKFYMVTELLGAHNYQVKIDVNYLDEGTTSWHIAYSGGATSPVVNTNSGLIKKASFVIPDMDGGGTQALGADFIVQSDDGVTEITLESIDSFTRVAENIGANLPPIVIIDTPNTTITLPTSSVSLTSTISDTDGTIASILWTHESGPAGSIIVTPTTANTNITGLAAGVHVFRVTATDNLGSTSFDEITITVNAAVGSGANPVAVITPVGTVNMPNAITTLDGSESYDTDGAIVSYLWALAGDSPTLSGFIIEDSPAPVTNVTFTLPGTFKFNLTVTDNDSNTNTASVTFQVNTLPTVVINTPDTSLVLPDNTLHIDATVTDIDGTVTLEWTERTGNTNYTIDSLTTDDVNLSDLEAGEYLFRLTATDNNDATAYAEIHVYVNNVFSGGLAVKTFRGYLCNDQGKTYYQDGNGNIQLASYVESTLPKEWQEIEIVQPRTGKYFALERNYTTAYTFVKDAAAIIRYLIYNNTQRGIESKLFFVVLKWDSVTGIYQPYFTSEVDLAKVVDDPHTGVLVNMLDGGAAKAIKTNENVIYEVPCNSTNTKCVKVLFDGLDLFDTFTWDTYDITTDPDGGVFTAPLTFVGNDGDSVGVTTANQRGEVVPSEITAFNAFVADTPFYLFSSHDPIVQGNLVGKIRFTTLTQNDATPPPGPSSTYFYAMPGNTFLKADWILLGSVLDVAGNTYEIDFDVLVDLAADEKLFIVMEPRQTVTGGTHSIEILPNDAITFSVTTKAPPTQSYALKPFDLFAALVEKISNGKYQAESSLLNEKWYLLAIAGDALRGIDTATIKSSFADFYDSYGKILNAAIGIRQSDQTILFERKEYFFDNNTEIVDIGEVEGLNISIAEDYLFNSINVGYADQNYQQRNGRNEFNDGQIYSTPMQRDPKELDLNSKYRADPYGIEFIRAELAFKETTDNVGDNNVFIVNVDSTTPVYDNFIVTKGSEIYTDQTVQVKFDTISDPNTQITANVDKDEFTYIGTIPQTLPIALNITGSYSGTTGFIISVRVNGVFWGSRVYTGVSPFNISFTDTRTLNPNDVITVMLQQMSVGGSVTISTATLTVSLLDVSGIFLYNLRRAAYSAISGVQATSTIYNIEELTPKRIVLANSSYLYGMLYPLSGELIQFESGKKNVLLSTTLNGVTIVENGNISVDDLAPSYYRSFIFEFTTKVPVNILNLLNNAGKGYITFSWNGFTMHGFPMEISVRPAFRDSQTWKLLCSSLTDIAGLQTVNENQLLIEDMGIISHKNSLKFVPVTDSFPLQYHLQQMDNDWHKNRISRYAVTKQYFQKQQTNDTTPMQFITRSVSIAIKILNCKGKTVDTINLSQVVNAAIINPMVLLEGIIDWSQYDEGTYYVYLIAGVGPTAAKYISEPIWVAEDWPKTLLIEFTNALNQQDMIFNGGYTGKIRVEGIIEKFKPDAKFTSFTDDPLDTDTIYGMAARSYTLFIGGDFGMPDWMIDKIQRILLLDSLKIEGYYYSIAPDAKLEAVEIPGSPYAYWSIEIRETNNRPGIPITGVGIDGGQLTVEYNINTKAFTALQTPTVNQEDNIVQVISVE